MLARRRKCLGQVIKNGDGSAGFAVYKSEPFVSSVDVVYGYAPWLNKYTGLFFVAANDRIKQKYSHGYKRNIERLLADRIMLPATNEGHPVWNFRERYVKNIMAGKYCQYLDYAENAKNET